MLLNAMDNIGTGVQALINNGAQHLLVPNLLDFSKAPAFNGDPGQAAAVKSLILGFNQGLQQTLNQLRAANPGVDIMGFDNAALFDRIFSNPSSYGFNNSTDACTTIENPVVFTAGCSATASDWLFWDGVHVTTAGHSVIAANMFKSIYDAPGPLPAAGGIVAFGWARRLRRRHRQATSAQGIKPAAMSRGAIKKA